MCEYAGSMLTVEIRESAGAREQTVASVSLHSEELKNTLHFAGRRSITDVFHPNFADYLHNVLARAIGAPMVLTEPDVIKSLGGAVIARMRMLVNKAMDGGRHITIRFAYFIGALGRLFRRDEFAHHSPLPHRERVAVQALDSICTPLANIASHLDRILENRDATEFVRSRLRKIEDETVELKFYTELLRRYVEDCARDRAASDRDWEARIVQSEVPSMLEEVERMIENGTARLQRRSETAKEAEADTGLAQAPRHTGIPVDIG